MDFEFSENQMVIRDAVREMLKKFDDPYWLKCDEEKLFPWEFYKQIADGGWLGISIPEQYGGGGLGITEAALVLGEIARSGAGMNGCSAIHLSIFGMSPVIKFANEDMRRRVLPEIASGRLHVAFAVTEPDAGSDTTAITTFARRERGGYRVHGRKVWISKAQEAEKMLLLTRTTKLEDCDSRTEGMTLLLADIDRNHVDVRPISKMGRNAVDSNELFIDDLFVAESDRIGDEGSGFRYLLDGLNAERILLAHEAVGIGRAAIARAVEYAKERIVFNRPIGSNQGIQFPLARALVHLDAAELMARKAAAMYDGGEDCAREANSAKYLCADAGFEAADAAVQTLGGFGYAREYHVERYFREARLLRLVPVSQELVLGFLAHHVLGLPRSY